MTRLSSAALLGLCATLSVVHLSGQTRGAQRETRQRIVYASALDQSGNPVPAIATTDVVIREDKVAREVLSVVPATEPMEITLLVDNSQAAEPYTRDIREAVSAFVKEIAADENGVKHQIGIYTIAERPTVNTAYTTDTERLLKGGQRIFSTPGSGAYLLDAIIETSQAISKRRVSRPVIVAMTTEGPELSDRPYQQVLEPLRQSGATLHVVVIGRPQNNNNDRSIVLDVGTRDTGGRYDTVLASNGLDKKMKQVADELTHQWQVTYARPDSLIPPDQVTVSSGKTGLVVRGIAAKDYRN